MKQRLHYMWLALLLLCIGTTANAQRAQVSTLSEAWTKAANCELVLSEGSNYKLQVLYVDEEHKDVYLWDGTYGMMLQESKDKMPGVETGKIILSGSISLNYVSWMDFFTVPENATITFGAKEEPIAPVEVTDPNLKKRYEFIKVKGQISDDGARLRYEGGTLYLKNDIGVNADLLACAGKKGHATGINTHYGLRVYPKAFFTEEQVNDPTRLDTFEELKALTTTGMQTFYIPNGTRVAFAKSTAKGGYLYLWNGTHGTHIEGTSVYSGILNREGQDSIEAGQLVTGNITAKYYAANSYKANNYFEYNTTLNPDSKHELAFGEKGEVVPRTVTSEQLHADAASKEYDDSYIRVHGILLAGNRLLTDDGKTIQLDDFFKLEPNFEQYVEHKGWAKGIAVRDVWDGTFTLRLIAADFFESEGLAEPVAVEYDAEQTNVIDKEVPIATATIKNMNLKAGKYSGICLPFDVAEERITEIFGEGTEIYTAKEYEATETADSIYLSTVKSIKAARVFIIKPAKDLQNVDFGRVNVVTSLPYTFTLTKHNWNNPKKRVIKATTAGYSAANLETVERAFTITEQGKLEAAKGTHRGFNSYFILQDEDIVNPIILIDGKVLDTEGGGEEPEEPEDPNAIKTFAELKAIKTNDMVTFQVPAGTRVLYAQKGNDVQSPYLFLWNGEDGLGIMGKDVARSIFKDGVTIEQGQLVKGKITSMYFGEQSHYFYYHKDYYTNSEDNLTFGEKGELTPKDVTGTDLMNNITTKAYDNSYIRMHGAFDAKKNFVTDDGKSFSLDDVFNTGIKLDDYVNHKGTLTVIAYKLIDSFKLYPISANAFEDEGENTAVDVVYDATQANTIDKEIPLANVTINNLSYKANTYSTICLPFALGKDEVARIFGAGTMVYFSETYRSTEEADTLFFKKSGDAAISNGHAYVIKPTQDVSTITVEKVTIKSDAPYANSFWKDENSESEKNINFTGSYSPVDLSKVSNAYCFDESGMLVEGKNILSGFSCYVSSENELHKLMAYIENQMVVNGIEIMMGEDAENGKIYNLNGQYVGNSLNNLKKGVYIRNGKKVMVK